MGEHGYIYVIQGTMNGKIRYYTGSTFRSLNERIGEHLAGKSKYTSLLKDKKLILSIEANSESIRSIEFFLKKNYRIVWSLTGREHRKNSLEKLNQWCEKHGAKIYNIRRVE